MISGEVIVFILANRGKPKLTTMHLESDSTKVSDALVDAGVDRDFKKDSTVWTTKLREKYFAALRKRGLQLMIVDNREKLGEEK